MFALLLVQICDFRAPLVMSQINVSGCSSNCSSIKGDMIENILDFNLTSSLL